ncbi:MAG: hypothetical protein R3E90_05085 [Marinicella sp.]
MQIAYKSSLIIIILLSFSFKISAGDLNCLFQDDAETYAAINGIDDAVLAGWSHGSDRGVDSWRVLPGSGVNLSKAFSVFEETDISLLGITDSFLITPEIFIPSQYYLEFMHKYDFEADSAYYDGGQLQISLNSGNSWSDLNLHIIAGGYNQVISSAYGSPIGGELAWAGEQDSYGRVQVDLSAFVGEVIQIRWRFVSGFDSIAQLGWRIDNIRVVDSIEPADAIFISQFETSDFDLCF